MSLRMLNLLQYLYRVGSSDARRFNKRTVSALLARKLIARDGDEISLAPSGRTLMVQLFHARPDWKDLPFGAGAYPGQEKG
jgi:hypothetical protein